MTVVPRGSLVGRTCGLLMHSSSAVFERRRHMRLSLPDKRIDRTTASSSRLPRRACQHPGSNKERASALAASSSEDGVSLAAKRGAEVTPRTTAPHFLSCLTCSFLSETANVAPTRACILNSSAVHSYPSIPPPAGQCTWQEGPRPVSQQDHSNLSCFNFLILFFYFLVLPSVFAGAVVTEDARVCIVWHPSSPQPSGPSVRE